MKGVELFLLDLDGTIYLGNQMIRGAGEFLQKVKQAGKRYCFLTNNSSRSSSDYLKKLSSLGIDAGPDEVLTSGYAAIRYLKAAFPSSRVFLMGTRSLKREFAEEGIRLVEESPEVVVVSYDTELDYEKLCQTCLFLRQGAFYVCTHPDLNCPSQRGSLPDAGSFMALIQKSTGRLPDIICGKPYPAMAQAVRDKFGLSGKKVAMVGDRLMTDIAFAKENGFVSVLVLSGETDRKALEESGVEPDFVFSSVREIISRI
jgi:HAD superfamily hydrolase (TIGR01457 family)